MEKIIYVAMSSADAQQPGPNSILTQAREAFADPRFRCVSVQLPRRDVEELRARRRGAVIRQDADSGPTRQLVALVSLWVDCADDLSAAERFMAGLSDDVTGYAVTEAVARWWPGPSGTPHAGVNAVSLLRRNPNMSRESFLAHWVQVHMPISLRYHPQWKYIRNPVERIVFGDVTNCPDAIAEEGFAAVEDLADPMRFYGTGGDPKNLEINKAIVFEDVPVFLDTATTETFVTEEHVLRAEWTPLADGSAPAPLPVDGTG